MALKPLKRERMYVTSRNEPDEIFECLRRNVRVNEIV